ncbi:MAG: nucleotidyltransferase family protein [Pseudomonadota bacterium]
MRTAALILAAGQSRRMGKQNKLLVQWRGKPLLAHVVEAAKHSQCFHTIVVTGHQRASVEAVVSENHPDARLVHNSRHSEGMGTTLAAGIAALDHTVEAVIVLLGDMPLVTSEHLNTMENKAAEWGDPMALVIASDGFVQGNPVLFGQGWFERLARSSGDRGARDILKSQAARILVEVGPAARRDFDTPEAFDSDC